MQRFFFGQVDRLGMAAVTEMADFARDTHTQRPRCAQESAAIYGGSALQEPEGIRRGQKNFRLGRPDPDWLPAPVPKFLDLLVDECRARFHQDGPFHAQLQLSHLI